MEDDSRQAPSGPVEQAVSPAGERTSPGLDRRKFIGALGGAAAAAAFLGSQGAAGSGQGANPPPILYQDSFGDIGPANPAALAAGIVPPPVPSQASAAVRMFCASSVHEWVLASLGGTASKSCSSSYQPN